MNNAGTIPLIPKIINKGIDAIVAIRGGIMVTFAANLVSCNPFNRPIYPLLNEINNNVMDNMIKSIV